MAFGHRVVDIIKGAKGTAQGQPQLPATVPPALDTIQGEWHADSELWGFVDFRQVYNYLRRSKGLRIPEEWRSLMPRSL